MNTIPVRLGPASYEITSGPGALGGLGALLGGSSAKIAVLSDKNVWALHGKALAAQLAAAGHSRPCVITLPAGEGSKSLEWLAIVYSKLARQHFGRGDLLLAFGGGVIGDLGGFAAATYMRGMRYIQLPTTLLAQVDSSVGGKTAVNIQEGKNLVGAFYQPSAVLMDTDLLATLPPREWGSGLAEMIKYGAILSRRLFEELRDWEKGDLPALEEMICSCCRIKSQIVEQDEHDRGQRMLLNFGHTFGHAIEALGHFAKHTHGEAVAIGMVLAARFGEELGITQSGTAQELVQTLQAKALDTVCPYPLTELLLLMRGDKKSEGDVVSLILLRQIGEAVIHKISYDELQARLEGMASI